MTFHTATTQPVALSETVRLTKGDGEIVFVFSDGRGPVQVDELGASVVWPYATAAAELVMRLRLGWQLVPVS